LAYSRTKEQIKIRDQTNHIKCFESLNNEYYAYDKLYSEQMLPCCLKLNLIQFSHSKFNGTNFLMLTLAICLTLKTQVQLHYKWTDVLMFSHAIMADGKNCLNQQTSPCKYQDLIRKPLT
jgi:hypothetical protein